MTDQPNEDSDPLETSVLLGAFEPVAPDASVWSRIEAEIKGPTPKPDAVAPEASRRPWFNWNMTVAFAAVFVLVLLMAGLVVTNDGGDAPLALETNRDLVDPITGDVVAVVSTGDRGQSVISNEGLPALGSDQTYQLWSVVGDEIVSVGVLGADPGTVPLRIEGDPAVLALTIEVTGGVAVSTQDPVAVWQASA